VKKLRDQIEKRKKARDEIINLRLKTIVNEAEGLGFPGAFDQDSEVNRHPRIGPGFSFGNVATPWGLAAPPPASLPGAPCRR